MLKCEVLILACPVYENQVSAQMKALFDRLFVWCHIFPLLGKYSLSAVTTGNDGYQQTGEYWPPTVPLRSRRFTTSAG